MMDKLLAIQGLIILNFSHYVVLYCTQLIFI